MGRIKMLRTVNFYDAADVFDKFFNGAVNALTPRIIIRRFELLTKDRALYYEISRDKAKTLYGVTLLYGVYREPQPKDRSGGVLTIHLTRGRVRGRSFTTREEAYRYARECVREIKKSLKKSLRRRRAKQ
jgi:hypothetical protein